MSREMALVVTVMFAAVLIAVGVIAWRRRTRRDRGFAAPVGEAPAGAVETFRSEGLYVATTRAGEPLERLAIAGLAFRSRVDVTVTDAGVALDLVGQPRVFLGLSRIVSVGQATVAIDRVVERDGLVRLSWTTDAGPLVDSYLRPQDTSARGLAAAIDGVLPSPPSHLPSPSGSDA